jgi:hypothetical protein
VASDQCAQNGIWVEHRIALNPLLADLPVCGFPSLTQLSEQDRGVQRARCSARDAMPPFSNMLLVLRSD